MEIETLQQRILIADDQQDILDALRLMLKGHGYTTRGVTSSSDLLEALAKDEFDVLLMDLNYARNSTSGQEGLDLLAVLQKNENLPPVVVMTGWATVGLAVEAMQRGVADFVEKNPGPTSGCWRSCKNKSRWDANVGSRDGGPGKKARHARR